MTRIRSGELTAGARPIFDRPSKTVARHGLRVMPLLDVDREFARCVPEAELAAARRHVLVPVFRLPRRRWEVPKIDRDRCSGFVVLAGTLVRAVSQVRRLDDRLILLLRILAERWGRVGPYGVELDLRLTHETVARLAGARRPSVSTALARLERNGALVREGRRFVLPLEAAALSSAVNA